jgi:phospholipase C
MGGFDLTATNSQRNDGLRSVAPISSVLAATKTDYTPHHNWFQYYASTANRISRPPDAQSARLAIPTPKDSSATPVHHEYDVNDFFQCRVCRKLPFGELSESACSG